jgi:hypothetical protein
MRRSAIIETYQVKLEPAEASSAAVCLSSSWRTTHVGHDRRLLRCMGITAPVIGSTPRLDHGQRGDEIEYWLRRRAREHRRFVILDDDVDLEPFMDRLVRTDWRVGLQDADCEKALRLLGEETSVKPSQRSCSLSSMNPSGPTRRKAAWLPLVPDPARRPAPSW